MNLPPALIATIIITLLSLLVTVVLTVVLKSQIKIEKGWIQGTGAAAVFFLVWYTMNETYQVAIKDGNDNEPTTSTEVAVKPTPTKTPIIVMTPKPTPLPTKKPIIPSQFVGKIGTKTLGQTILNKPLVIPTKRIVKGDAQMVGLLTYGQYKRIPPDLRNKVPQKYFLSKYRFTTEIARSLKINGDEYSQVQRWRRTFRAEELGKTRR